MISPGDILCNPAEGEVFTFLQTQASSNGNVLQLSVSLAPGKTFSVGGQHAHPRQKKFFFVKSGKMWAIVNGVRRQFGPGEALFLPEGFAHRWGNACAEESLLVTCEMRPALHTERVLVAWCRYRQQVAAGAGRTWDAWRPLVSVLAQYADHFSLSGVSGWLLRLACRSLVKPGKATAIDPANPESNPEHQEALLAPAI
jgi:quercetin dioxygenase-like cupin family protein